jgi:hypothetical protein
MMRLPDRPFGTLDAELKRRAKARKKQKPDLTRWRYPKILTVQERYERHLIEVVGVQNRLKTEFYDAVSVPAAQRRLQMASRI